jgi:hypothetical protein
MYLRIFKEKTKNAPVVYFFPFIRPCVFRSSHSTIIRLLDLKNTVAYSAMHTSEIQFYNVLCSSKNHDVC